MRQPVLLRFRRICVGLMLLLTLAAMWSTAHARMAATPEPKTAAKSVAAKPAETGSLAALKTTLDERETQLLISGFFVLVMAGFVGFEVIGGVSPLLHTPLMALTNAISAISVVGALIVAGTQEYHDLPSRLLGLAAVTAAMINVVGGFMITYRMLRMFKPKEARHS
jgi:H+-translocating NAD(P) transhydrogenase subunit alpha